MASIEGFLDELIPVIRGASGIRYVPDDPPASIANDPAAVIFLYEGRCEIGPPGVATYHHGVRVGLITSIENTAIANQRILPKIETVIEAVWNKLRDTISPFTETQNIEAITFTYGPIEWGNVWYFGAMIDLENVKIQRVLT